MPLDGIKAPARVLESGDPGSACPGRTPGTGRRLDCRVPVRHPHRHAVGQPGEEVRYGVDVRLRPAELAFVSTPDLTAERHGHGLEPVADAEHRYAGGKKGGIDGGSALCVDALRPPGKYYRARPASDDIGHRRRVRHDLAVNMGLAHPAGD